MAGGTQAQAPAWLLSLLLTAGLMVGSLMLFMGKHPIQTAVHPGHVASVLERQHSNSVTGIENALPPCNPETAGHGGLMVPHAADAHTELQEARSQIEQHADELEVAALTEARLTTALREVQAQLKAARKNLVVLDLDVSRFTARGQHDAPAPTNGGSLRHPSLPPPAPFLLTFAIALCMY